MQFPKLFGKSLYFFVAVVLVAVVLASAAYFLTRGTPIVASGDTVQVYYTGRFTNGTVFDSNIGKSPLQFKVGASQVIHGFDYGVIGMKLGENRTLTITPSEAYGLVNPNLIVEVPLSVFGANAVTPGMEIQETINGTEAVGVVKSVNATFANIDFNHPLAGDTLVFQVTIASITKG
jgi:peptidylprolyl isomerase